MEVPAAGRLERPAWINLRTALGLILFAVAFFAGERMLAAGSETSAVWVAARDLTAGDVLGAGDLRPADVNLPADLSSSYLPTSEDLIGSVVARTVRRGELLASAWVSRSGVSTGAAVTIPVSIEHAVGGALRVGDLVDVYATYDSGDLRARTELVVRGAEVLDVVNSGGFVSGDESLIGVTISIEPDAGDEIAGAVRTAQIDLVRVTGARGDDE